MYSFIKKIGYSDCDVNGDVTLFSIMNMLQDIGTYFNEDADLGESYLKENDLGWIVYNWNIDIKSIPNLYKNKEIEVSTVVYENKGAVVNRYYEIRNDKGKIVLNAYATWVLIKFSTGHPTRLTPEIKQKISKEVFDESIKKSIEKTAISEYGTLEKLEQREVPYSYIDMRNHMNNARYLECLAEHIDIKSIDKIHITYQFPLVYKQIFDIKKYIKDKNTYYLFCTKQMNAESDEDVVSCVIRIEKKE